MYASGKHPWLKKAIPVLLNIPSSLTGNKCGRTLAWPYNVRTYFGMAVLG